MNSKASLWRLLLHLPKLVRLVARLIRDRRVPLAGKAAVFLGIAYFLSPVDLIPDFLVPVIGSLDDAAVLLLCLRYLFYRTPPAVLREHLSNLTEYAG
jgi:uncharacterized membrane protein YkvA (DUF1232 family)